jgi:hypothetical protein
MMSIPHRWPAVYEKNYSNREELVPYHITWTRLGDRGSNVDIRTTLQELERASET